jgi:hypothetical protein
MPLIERPYIDQAVWDIINPFLTQLHNPGNGGFQIYNEGNRPNNLTINDVGKTIWNNTKGCFQEWSGGYWVDLRPKRGAIEDVVLEIISTWNPSTPPQWITDMINNALSGLNMSVLQSILDTWTPGISSPLRTLITEISIQVFNTGITPVTDYINGLLGSSNAEAIPLSRILGALDSYWANNMLPYITIQDDLIKAYVDQKITALDSRLTTDINTKYNTLLVALNTHTHAGTSTPTPVQTPAPTPSPTPSPSLSNVNVTLTQRPGTMRVSYVPPYSQGTATGVRVVEAAFDVSITYTGTGVASSLAATYFAPSNGYTTPSGEKKIIGYGVESIGSTASPYILQNFYLPITTTSTVTPRKTWKYYIVKGNDGSNYMQYDTNTNWNTFMSNYYLDHVEIPYGGFDTSAWLAFWNTLDANTKSLFPQF